MKDNATPIISLELLIIIYLIFKNKFWNLLDNEASNILCQTDQQSGKLHADMD